MTAVTMPALHEQSPRSAASAGSGGLEVRPDGVVPIRRPGRSPYRVLAFGGGALVGWGLLDHERGLPGHIADRIAQKSGRGVDLDVIIEVDPTRPASLNGLRGLRIARYDAIVVLLGERAALEHMSRGPWGAEFEGLVQALHAEASKSAPLLVFDSSRPMISVSSSGLKMRRAMSSAGKLADVARGICENGRIGFGELAAPASVLGWGRQFAMSNLRGWAEEIVSALLPALDAAVKLTGPDTAVAVREREQDEAYRQRAVDSMRLSAHERDGLLDGIARQAKAAYRGSAAYVTLVDGDRVWQRASSQSVLGELPRSMSYCDLTVRSDVVTLVNDTTLDPRFGGVAPEVGGMPMAFYVGEPIHSVDGYRVGSLCVTDVKARQMRPEQFAELHALAGRVEKELWVQSLGGRR